MQLGMVQRILNTIELLLNFNECTYVPMKLYSLPSSVIKIVTFIFISRLFVVRFSFLII